MESHEETGGSEDHFPDHFSEEGIGMLSSQVDVPVAGSVAGGVTEPVGQGDIAPESDAVKPVQHREDEDCQDPDELERMEDMFEGANDGTNDGMNDDQDCDDKDAKEEGDDEDDKEEEDKEEEDKEEEDNEDDKEEKEVKQSKREEEDDDEFDPDSIITESAFWHVEASRENGFKEGMKVEILYEDNKYWYATIVTNFGQLLSLEWCGSRETFFHDVKRNNLYQIGATAKTRPRIVDSTLVPGDIPDPGNIPDPGDIPDPGGSVGESEGNIGEGIRKEESDPKESEEMTLEESELRKLLQECAEAAKVSTEKSQVSRSVLSPVLERMPPESLDLTEKEVEEVISEIESIGTETLPLAGFSPDLFREGMMLQVNLVHSPTKKWLATIIKNVGGRLLLRWLLPPDKAESQLEDFWLFFSHPRIHSLHENTEGRIHEDTEGRIHEDIEGTFQPPIEFDDWSLFVKEALREEERTSLKDEGERISREESLREETLRRVFLKRCKERRPQLLESNCIKNVKAGDKVLLFPSDLLRLVPATVEEKIEDFLRIKCDVPIECLLPDSLPTPPHLPGTPTEKKTDTLTGTPTEKKTDTLTDCQGALADSQDSQDTDLESTSKESNQGEIVPKEGEIVPKIEATLTEFAFVYPIEDTHAILPFNWTEENEIPLELGIDHVDIGSYLKVNNTRAAPIKLKSNDSMIKLFKSNGRIEVVHPDDPSLICEGIVIRITPPLIWIQISEERIRVVPFNSTEIFPSGFAESNGSELTKLLPTKYRSSPYKSRSQGSAQGSESGSLGRKEEREGAVGVMKSLSPTFSSSRSWCPRIYFNYKCFTGPSLSKSKLCNLPRFVGPGPVLLVMQEVISKILSIAYVSSRILNDLASDSFQELLEENDIYKIEHVQFKAKYNNSSKTTRLNIPVIRNAEKVDEYCHIMCSHLKCCFNLFGPKLYDGDTCPSNCRGLTKSNKVLKKAAFYREQAAAAKLGQTIDLAQLAEGKSNVKKLAKRTATSGSTDSYDPFGLLKKKPSKEGGNSHPVIREGSQSGSDGSQEREREREQEREKDPSQADGENEGTNREEGDRPKQRGRPPKKRAPSESKENTPSKKKGKWGGDRRSGTYAGGHHSGRNYDDPLNWSIDTVHKYIKNSDCSVFATLLKEQEIDGAALMLLDYDTIASNILTGYTLKFNQNDIHRLSCLVMRLRSNWFKHAHAQR